MQRRYRETRRQGTLDQGRPPLRRSRRRVWLPIGIIGLLLFCLCGIPGTFYLLVRGKSTDSSILGQLIGPPPAHVFTVALDPGHGGVDSGSVWPVGSNDPQFTEAAINLHVARRLRDKLTSAGIQVVMTRDSEVDVGLAERVQIAEGKRADLFLSIHHNANDDPTVSGSQIYCDPRDIPLGDLFAEELRRNFGPYHIIDHGVAPNSDFVVLKGTAPSILSEAAYITNEREISLLGTDSSGFQDAEATAFYRAIMRYRGGEGHPSSATPTPPGSS